tara:strand:- start:239694 stop:240734 length:1041 start_codon:yes stop_codon:yes gene_type:complete
LRHFYQEIPFFAVQFLKKSIFMKRSLFILFILGLLTPVKAQSISVSTSTSEVKTYSASLVGTNIEIMDGDGQTVLSTKYNMPAEGDESFDVYPLDNGGFVVRENIANFLIFNSYGRVAHSVSNSTQSAGGEAISELAMDPNGKTIVVYNPKVISGGQTGSRAQRIEVSKVTLNLYYSADRALKNVVVSPDGALIAFVSEKAGTDDEVEIMDRYGNTLQTISFDQDVEGVSFSENGLYATIFSTGRAAAYQVRSGDRVGSSSSFGDQPLRYATYDPVEKTILGISASGGSTWANVEAHAISVSRRKLTHESISGSFTRQTVIDLKKTGTGNYTLTGLDKNLNLKVRF